MAEDAPGNLFPFAEFISNKDSVAWSIIYYLMHDTETLTNSLIVASKNAAHHQMLFKIHCRSYHNHRRNLKVLSLSLSTAPGEMCRYS